MKKKHYKLQEKNRKNRQPSAMRKKCFKGCSSLHPASEGRRGRAFTWKRPRLYGFPHLRQKRLPQYLERNFRQAYSRRFLRFFNIVFLHFSWQCLVWLQCKGYHWMQHKILRLLMYRNPDLGHFFMQLCKSSFVRAAQLPNLATSC